MAFESLLNKPMTEKKLLSSFVEEIQKEYDLHQNTCYFLKLSWLGDKTSQIIWVKSFDNPKDFVDFIYDTKFMRCFFLLKFRNGRYEVMCQGFSFFDDFEVWPDKISNSRPMESVPTDYEKTPMPPRELIEDAFGEISQAVASSKSSIPV